MERQLRKWRRDLHRIPELDDQVDKTMKYLTSVLLKYDVNILYPAKGSMAVYFDYGAISTIAFRADMDALPMQEKNTHAYVSIQEGNMHACGHDGHMTILLGFIDCLTKIKEKPAVNVLCIFQSSEETGGGAQRICESGILEKYHVKAIYGMHLYPEGKLGTLYSKSGLLFYASSEMNITIIGKSAHCGQSEYGKDALRQGINLYHKLNKKEEDLLCFIGTLNAGEGRNIVPSLCKIQGTIRSDTYHKIIHYQTYIHKQCEEIKQQGFQVQQSYSQGYQELINHARLYLFHEKQLQIHKLLKPFYLSDDFSAFGKRIPSLYLLLGCNSETMLHSDRFDFNETSLVYGVNAYYKIIMAYK